MDHPFFHFSKEAGVANLWFGPVGIHLWDRRWWRFGGKWHSPITLDWEPKWNKDV